MKVTLALAAVALSIASTVQALPVLAKDNALEVRSTPSTQAIDASTLTRRIWDSPMPGWFFNNWKRSVHAGEAQTDDLKRRIFNQPVDIITGSFRRSIQEGKATADELKRRIFMPLPELDYGFLPHKRSVKGSIVETHNVDEVKDADSLAARTIAFPIPFFHHPVNPTFPHLKRASDENETNSVLSKRSEDTAVTNNKA